MVQVKGNHNKHKGHYEDILVSQVSLFSFFF